MFVPSNLQEFSMYKYTLILNLLIGDIYTYWLYFLTTPNKVDNYFVDIGLHFSYLGVKLMDFI